MTPERGTQTGWALYLPSLTALSFQAAAWQGEPRQSLGDSLSSQHIPEHVGGSQDRALEKRQWPRARNRMMHTHTAECWSAYMCKGSTQGQEKSHPEGLGAVVPGAQTWLGILSDPAAKPGKPHDSWRRGQTTQILLQEWGLISPRPSPILVSPNKS